MWSLGSLREMKCDSCVDQFLTRSLYVCENQLPDNKRTYIRIIPTMHHRKLLFVSIVTRLGDLLDFGQLFKAFGNNSFAEISYILRQFL